jgi:hypothetical protein
VESECLVLQNPVVYFDQHFFWFSHHEILIFCAYRWPGAPEIGGILRGQALGKAFGYSGEYDVEEVQIQLEEAIKTEDFIRERRRSWIRIHDTHDVPPQSLRGCFSYLPGDYVSC